RRSSSRIPVHAQDARRRTPCALLTGPEIGSDGVRVRIGLITHDFERTGGHSRYVVELARRFARDHEVHVFANTFGEPLPAGARAHAVRAVRRTALTTIL